MTAASTPTTGTTVQDTGPLDWRIAIVDGNGRPTNEFMRRWNAQRNNNGLITPVTVANGAPGSPVPGDGSEYIDISTSPPTLYVASEGTWLKVGVYNFLDLMDVPHSYSGDGGEIVQVNSGATGLEFNTLSNILDALGSSQGDVLYRGASGWSVLAPGTSGYALVTGGAGANPSWAPAGSSLIVQNNGTTITTNATQINFSTNLTATVSGTDVTVVATGGGGGGTPPLVDGIPVVLPALSTFTWFNQGGGSATSHTGGPISMIIPPSSGDAIRGLVKTLPGSTPWTMTAKLSGVLWQSNYTCFGLGLVDSAGKIITWDATGRGNNGSGNTTEMQLVRWSNSTTYNSQPWGLNGINISVSQWLRIYNDGTNLYYSISINGADWILCHQEAITAYLGTIVSGGVLTDWNDTVGIGVNINANIWSFEFVTGTGTNSTW